MKIATCSLDFYKQNSVAETEKVGAIVRKQGIEIAGFTEVRGPNMRKGLQLGLTSAYGLNGEETAESPQANLVKNWTLIDTVIKKATDGIAGITPDLFIVICVYRKNNNARKVIEVISTHLVPLTFKGKKRDNFAKRMVMWKKHWAVLKEVVHDCLALGRSAFIIGDFNNFAAPKNIIKEIHPKAKWIIRKGLDWVFAVEGKIKIRRMGPIRRFSTGSDHPAYWRQVILA